MTRPTTEPSRFSLMTTLKSILRIVNDNNRDEKCIVDVRDVVTGEVLPYRKFINKYVVRVEPHRAILEPDYFIKLIEQAEALRDEEVNNSINNLYNRLKDLIRVWTQRMRGDRMTTEVGKVTGKSCRNCPMRST